MNEKERRAAQALRDMIESAMKIGVKLDETVKSGLLTRSDIGPARNQVQNLLNELQTLIGDVERD